MNLPVQSLVQRFGTEGRLAHELAQGRDSRNPTVPETELRFECWADIGGAISLLATIPTFVADKIAGLP